MTLKSDAKFKNKLTCGLENEGIFGNFGGIFTRALESVNIRTLM